MAELRGLACGDLLAGRLHTDSVSTAFTGQSSANASSFVLLWQITSKAMGDALLHVLGRLVARGLVKEVPPKESGKSGAMWMVCNHYEKGEPFPKPEGSSKRAGRAEEENSNVVEEEQLADIEKERLRNIERNKEILRQLGLA